MYGIKQEPRACYTTIDTYFTGLGFTNSEADAKLYEIVVDCKLLIILIYVNGMLLKCNENLINYFKEDLAREFEMMDMGIFHYFLGLEIWQRDKEIFVYEGKYATDIMMKFHMEGSKPIETPLTGIWRKKDATSGKVEDAMMYLVNTQPDICYTVK